MTKTTEMTPARRRRVPKELEDLYWALPVEGRQRCMKDARWYAEWERRRRKRQAELAAGKWIKVSFSISPEQFRVLQTLADANNDPDEGGSYKPGRAAHEVLMWVMPALERLAESKDCRFGVGVALHHQYGEPWHRSSRVGLAKPDGAV